MDRDRASAYLLNKSRCMPCQTIVPSDATMRTLMGAVEMMTASTEASGKTARIALFAVSRSCRPPSQLALYSTVNLGPLPWASVVGILDSEDPMATKRVGPERKSKAGRERARARVSMRRPT